MLNVKTQTSSPNKKEKNKNTILIFSCFLEPFLGGAELYVKEITKNLKDKYNFIIITSRFFKDLPRFEQKQNIKIYRVGIGIKLDKYLYPILAPFKSFFINHQLLHAVLESYAGLALIFYRIFQKKPILLTLQSDNVNIPNFLFKEIHLIPDKIQAISKKLAERARNFGAKNIEIIPNGVDLEFFKNKYNQIINQNQVAKEKHRIICVANFKKHKGINYLISAMPEILRSFPDTKLVLVGKGPERKNLESQISNLKIENSVELKGGLPHQKIPEELFKSEAFVLPSVSEGLGIAILEAQAIGIPVVASKIGGIPDIIENGRTGILIKPKSSRAISQAVFKIFSQPDFAKSLTQNAKINIKKYDWKNIAEKIEKIYQEMLNYKTI